MPKSKTKTAPRGWGSLTPEERSAEMKRRMAMRKAKRADEVPVVSLDNTASIPFTQLGDDEKARLIKEYYALPLSDKQDWREKYGLTATMATYYHGRLVKKRKAMDPAAAAALQQYKGLSRFEKAPWRKAHNIGPAQMSLIITGKATPGVISRLVNGNLPSVRDQRIARFLEPVEVPVPSTVPNSAPPAASVPGTLQYAIEAMEIKRDLLSTFIEELKTMQRGHR